MQRARLLAASKDRDGSLDDLQALDRTLAPQAHLRLDVARLYMEFDLPDRAIPQWNLWIASHRKEAGLDGVLNSRCWARAMLGIELDKALDDCNEALDRQPKNAVFLDSRAWVRLRRGELRDALADYDRALGIKPDQAWSLYGRGIREGRSWATPRKAARTSTPRASSGHRSMPTQPATGSLPTIRDCPSARRSA